MYWTSVLVRVGSNTVLCFYYSTFFVTCNFAFLKIFVVLVKKTQDTIFPIWKGTLVLLPLVVQKLTTRCHQCTFSPYSVADSACRLWLGKNGRPSSIYAGLAAIFACPIMATQLGCSIFPSSEFNLPGSQKSHSLTQPHPYSLCHIVCMCEKVHNIYNK